MNDFKGILKLMERHGRDRDEGEGTELRVVKRRHGREEDYCRERGDAGGEEGFQIGRIRSIHTSFGLVVWHTKKVRYRFSQSSYGVKVIITDLVTISDKQDCLDNSIQV